MDPSRREQLEYFILSNKIPIIDISILDQALTHRSFVNELKRSIPKKKERRYNERLEFLGDAILGLIISKSLLYKIS